MPKAQNESAKAAVFHKEVGASPEDAQRQTVLVTECDYGGEVRFVGWFGVNVRWTTYAKRGFLCQRFAGANDGLGRYLTSQVQLESRVCGVGIFQDRFRLVQA
jgi:hypothetical protein